MQAKRSVANIRAVGLAIRKSNWPADRASAIALPHALPVFRPKLVVLAPQLLVLTSSSRDRGNVG